LTYDTNFYRSDFTNFDRIFHQKLRSAYDFKANKEIQLSTTNSIRT